MVTPVMISHFTRGGPGGLREQSIAALNEAGINPIVFESTVQNGSDVEVKRIAWHAISSGFGGSVLFFEDDITVDPVALRAFMNMDKGDHDVITLCLLRKSLLGDVKREGIVPIRKEAWSADRGFHGSMGLWLSTVMVDWLVARKGDFMRKDGTPIKHPITPSELRRGKPCGFDFWLKDNAMKPAVMLPNPIGHRSDQVTTIS
jgi:hypothetical protein